MVRSSLLPEAGPDPYMLKKGISLLNELLKKRGIDKVENLQPDEAVVYDRYRRILTGEVVTLASIKEFCQSQIRIIESKCDGVVPLTTLQQASMHVYLNLLKATEAPEMERESLEKHLNQILES